MVTVGVAIPIPQPWGGQLDAARAATGDPQAVHVPSHITLLGPTEVDADALPQIESHLDAAAAASRPFDIHLRGTGSFRPVTEVVFVVVAEGVSECEKLEAMVRSGPLDRPLSYPYHPHVTVAHGVPAAQLDAVYTQLADFDTRFTAPGFVLYTHDCDLAWRPRREFGFAAAL